MVWAAHDDLEREDRDRRQDRLGDGLKAGPIKGIDLSRIVADAVGPFDISLFAQVQPLEEFTTPRFADKVYMF